MVTLVDILLGAFSLYLMAGVLFSVYFYLIAGVKIDEGMKSTPWHFKLIILPGVILFWSILLKKLVKRL